MCSPHPKVSIGIPVFNGERYIAEAIESLIEQSFEDWELVISDNGSTDATQQICEQFSGADARIRFVRSPANRGAAWNFNNVLQLSRGEYFKWLAADDYCAPEFLATALDALEQSPDACLAYSPGTFVTSDGRPMYDGSQFRPPAGWPARASDRARALVRLLLEDGRAAQVLVFGLARRDALRRVRPLGAYYAADWTLAMELLLQAPVIEVSSELIFFRQHPDSSSSGSNWWNRGIQRRFYDPRVNDRWGRIATHYRRNVELLYAMLIAPLPYSARASLVSTTAYAEARLLIPSAVSRARNAVTGVIRGH